MNEIDATKVLYVECRQAAVAAGMTKEAFDLRMKQVFKDMTEFGRYMRVKMMTGHQLAEALHTCFYTIQCSDSPIKRHEMMADLSRQFFIEPALLMEEFANWFEQNKEKTVDQMVEASQKRLMEAFDRNHPPKK